MSYQIHALKRERGRKEMKVVYLVMAYPLKKSDDHYVASIWSNKDDANEECKRLICYEKGGRKMYEFQTEPWTVQRRKKRNES